MARSQSAIDATERLQKVVTSLESFLEAGDLSKVSSATADHSELTKIAEENASLKQKHEKVKLRLDKLITQVSSEAKGAV